MKIIIQDTAHNSIDNIFDYIYNYSSRNALETIEGIYERIYNLENFSHIGRFIDKVPDKHIREIIYRINRKQAYRIIYHISELNNTIHILYVVNCKQDFNHILKVNNYFINYFEF